MDDTDDELASLSEFIFLQENARQAGVSGPLPAAARIEHGPVSAVKFGDDAPRVVFLHGLFGQGRNFTQIAKAMTPDFQFVDFETPHALTADEIAEVARAGVSRAAPIGDGRELVVYFLDENAVLLHSRHCP